MKLILTSLFILLYQFSFSQDALPTNCLTYSVASYGSKDFTMEQYGVAQFTDPITMSPLISYKRSNTPNLSDVRYPPKTFKGFTDEACNNDITDGMTKCDLNTSVTDLNYVVYYPTSLTTGTTTKGCLFPAIILFHGGGFDDCKKPSIADASLGGIGAIAQEFAKHGYVAYVVEYRTGRYAAPYGAFLSAQQSLAEYRAFQDARGAIRSIIRHQRRTMDFPNDPYQIDTMKIFLGGNSAGSIMAIHSAYYNAAQIAAIFPTPPGQPTIATALGPVDIDYYYGGLNTGVNSDYRPLIKGVFNMWGQMLVPFNYFNAANSTYHLQDFWTDYGNTIIPPMIAFHGYNDLTLPIVRTNITFAPDHIVTVINNMNMPEQVDYTYFNSENNCLLNSPTPYKLDGSEATPDLVGAGSKGMYDMFHTLAFNQRIELHVDCEMSHGLDADVTCSVCGQFNPGIVVKGKCQVCTPFQSNFGTPYYNSTDVQKYMVQRAVTFFQAVLTNQVTN